MAISDDQLQEQLDNYFRPSATSDAPGMVIGVARRGRVIYRRGFGMASLESGWSNSPATRMRIGSISKHMTCLAVLLLAEEGKLDPDAGIRSYLPELPDLGDDPTLRQLMQHVGGLRCYLDLGFISAGLAVQPEGAALAAVLRQSESNFPPGKKYIYSNSGYHLLSLVIARLSGMSFEAFMKERIFQPLGMLDTESAPSDLDILPRVATLHMKLPSGQYRRGILPTEEARGEGATVSTIDDMLLWAAHLRGKKLVGNSATWEQMLSATTRLSNGFEIDYGLGLNHIEYRGVSIVCHSGSVIGGTSQMVTVPEHELDIVVLTNSFNKPGAIEVGDRILDALLGHDGNVPAEELVPLRGYESLIGTSYHSPTTGMLIGFVESDGKVALKILNSAPIPLRQNDGELELPRRLTATGPYRFAIDRQHIGADVSEHLELSEAGNIEQMRRLPTQPPKAEELKAFVGSYWCSDLHAGASVTLGDNAFRVTIAGHGGGSTLDAIPLSRDVFACQGGEPTVPVTASLDLQRRDDAVVGFRLNTLRTRHLKFTRTERNS